MPFVKSHQAAQPFLSGCDDQPPPTEIQQGLESLYQQWTDNKKMSDTAKDKAALDRKKGNAMGEALRQKAIGKFVPKAPNGEDDANFLVGIGYGEGDDFETLMVSRTGQGRRGSTSAASAPMVSAAPSTSSGMVMTRDRGRVDDLRAALVNRNDVKMQKEANKKRKLELEEQRFLEELKDKEANRLLMMSLLKKLTDGNTQNI